MSLVHITAGLLSFHCRCNGLESQSILNVVLLSFSNRFMHTAHDSYMSKVSAVYPEQDVVPPRFECCLWTSNMHVKG